MRGREREREREREMWESMLLTSPPPNKSGWEEVLMNMGNFFLFLNQGPPLFCI